MCLIRQNKGFSLMELMIAVVIMSIISLAVTTMFINTSQNYGKDERIARMQENGRFALNMMAHDIVMADFWGEALDPGIIDSTGFNTTAAAQCYTSTATTIDTVVRSSSILDMETALLYFKSGAGTLMFDPSACANLYATNTNYLAGSNAFLVKRVANEPATTPAQNIVYVRNGGTTNILFMDTNTTPVATPAGDVDWAYQPKLYYIREDASNVPSLCRAVITEGTTTVGFQAVDNGECIAEGIEQLHIEFGLDTDSDLVPNQYKSDITTIEAETVVAIRIYLLARTADADTTYTNDKSYNLGDLAIAAANDNFYRRVYTTTVVLRNPKAYIALSQ